MHIPELLQQHKQYYHSGATRSLSFRIEQLHKLKQAIVKREADIFKALRADLNKSDFEAYTFEIGLVYNEISFITKNLRKWAKPKKVKTALTHFGSRGYIVPEPLGTSLVIAPWNYPFMLAFLPMIGAIAAGNTVIIKPSELAPNISSLMAAIVQETFEPQFVAIVEGGVEESQELLDQPFDHFFFTGSVAVGKVVMQAAAKRLIPVTLELGGKSP